jgi:beta-N-acetylhexosaminidase
MLMIGLAGTELAERERAWLASPVVAGVILFARNYVDRAQLIALVESIRAVGGERMLVAVDQEGGAVQRFRDGFTRLPPLAAIGAVHDRDPAEALRLAEEHAWLMASELRACDVDFSYAPVLDLARGNAAIGARAFHADPHVVAELAQAYVRGMRMAGMAAVLKHFPGHGAASADTHKDSAVDMRPLEVLRDEDMLPFAQGIDAHAEAVMMAHVAYPLVDEYPAGFSRAWIGQVLRGELGFEGVVISDDIGMAAAGAVGDIAARVRAHLAAGCDLVLACAPAVVEEAIAAVPAPPIEVTRLATLHGAVASTWASLEDNPQRNRFVARITALDAGSQA